MKLELIGYCEVEVKPNFHIAMRIVRQQNRTNGK